VYRIYFAHCMYIFTSLLAQLVKYDVHTTHKINSIHVIFYHILSLYCHTVASCCTSSRSCHGQMMGQLICINEPDEERMLCLPFSEGFVLYYKVLNSSEKPYISG